MNMAESGQPLSVPERRTTDMEFSAVRTTGIYCRPGCGARPRADNVQTFEMAAAAEAAGYRACLRCRPYRVGGAVPWAAPEFVCRAVQLIIGGALDDGSEADLGARLGMSARHLRRLFRQHLGLTPDQFARSRRAHFARRLLDDTDLGIADIAFASGFSSLRQFNRTMTEVFRATPSQLRARRRRGDRIVTDGGLALRLPFRAPYDWPKVAALLAERAIPGVESVIDGTYRRPSVWMGRRESWRSPRAARTIWCFVRTCPTGKASFTSWSARRKSWASTTTRPKAFDSSGATR